MLFRGGGREGGELNLMEDEGRWEKVDLRGSSSSAINCLGLPLDPHLCTWVPGGRTDAG